MSVDAKDVWMVSRHSTGLHPICFYNGATDDKFSP